MKIGKNIFWILFIVMGCYGEGNAQNISPKVMAKFDTLIYESDSSIIVLAHLKNGKLDGYAVEFSRSGYPMSIGKYRKGVKDGNWYESSGCVIYEDGIMGCPTCGNALSNNRKLFKDLCFYQTGINLYIRKGKENPLHM